MSDVITVNVVLTKRFLAATFWDAATEWIRDEGRRFDLVAWLLVIRLWLRIRIWGTRWA